MPTEGHGLGRAIAGLIGMDQESINQRVKEGALPEFQQQIPREALEEAQERIAGETAERNADLRAKGLVGNGAFAIQNTDFQLTDLLLRSRPQGVLVTGRLSLRDKTGHGGADMPQPASFRTIDQGIRASVHVGSLLGSLAAGAYQREEVRSVDNLMIVVKDVPPGTPPREGLEGPRTWISRPLPSGSPKLASPRREPPRRRFSGSSSPSRPPNSAPTPAASSSLSFTTSRLMCLRLRTRKKAGLSARLPRSIGSRFRSPSLLVIQGRPDQGRRDGGPCQGRGLQSGDRRAGARHRR